MQPYYPIPVGAHARIIAREEAPVTKLKPKRVTTWPVTLERPGVGPYHYHRSVRTLRTVESKEVRP